MNQRTVLVTGATGFTGAHFVREAAVQDFRCIAVSHRANKAVEGAEHLMEVDLTDRGATFDLMRTVQPEYVVHLAAVSFVGHGDLSELYLTNVVGTINLLDGAIALNPNLRRVIVASSANVYGNADVLPIREASSPKPQNDYAISKLAMEHAISIRNSGSKVVIVRPFNYTGVGQGSHFLVPKIVAAYARKDRALALGNIDVSRDFSDVRDVVSAYLALLNAPLRSSVVNLCSGRAFTVRQILEYMNRLAGHELKVQSTASLTRTHEVARLYGSDELLQSIIGDYRRHTFEDTLRWMYMERCAHL